MEFLDMLGKKASEAYKVTADKTGKIKEINAEDIGKLACYLGAGRVKKDDKIDSNVGIILNKKVGDEVIADDFLAYICVNDENKIKEAEKRILEIYKIS